MKYLITGGNGFVGKFLKNLLIKNGHEVKTIGRSPLNNFQIDLTKDSIIISENFDVIIHTASIVHNSSHAGTFNEHLITDDLNITFNFLKSIEKIQYQKIIFLSSVSVYGLEHGKDIGISQPLLPKSGYGLSKSISEKILQLGINYKKLLILRLPLINGPNPKGNIRRALDTINSRKMFLFNGNTAIKSVLELDDLYTFIVSKYSKFNGIHQLKSYDVRFNDFIQGLSSEKIYRLPYIFLKFSLFISNTLKMNNMYHTLSKVSKDLTFLDSTKL